MQKRFRFISPFFLFLLITFTVASVNVHVQPVYAVGQAGWELVKEYTFSGSLNQSEWDIYKFPNWALDPTIVNNCLNLTISTSANNLHHPYCEILSAVKTKLMFSPSMRIKIHAYFNVSLLPWTKGIMIGFWLMHDNDEGRNEIAFEYHSSRIIYLGSSIYGDVHPSMYYNSPYGGVTWKCRDGCDHYTSPAVDFGYIMVPDFWNTWCDFTIDIGYYNTTHKSVVHYINGWKVFDSGLRTDIPTVPMWLFIGISVPAWETNLSSDLKGTLLVDNVKVYYWMDKLDNGNFESGMTYWDYKNFEAIDFDSDGDKEAHPTDLNEYWFGQQISYKYQTLTLRWKLQLLNANPNGIIRFWFKNPYDYNMSLTLKYISSVGQTAKFEVTFSIKTPTQYIERINYHYLQFASWINCYFRKDGSLLEYQLGYEINKLSISVPELAKLCLASFVGLDGYQQTFLVDDISISFNLPFQDYVILKLNRVGDGLIVPEQGYYALVNNTVFNIRSYPLNSSVYTVWNIKSNTDNYNVTSEKLQVIVNKNYEITAYFIYGIPYQTYTIDYGNYWEWGQERSGYKIDFIKGSTNPSFGVYNNTGGTLQLTASAYAGYFFYRWMGQLENFSTIYFPVNQNVINVNLSQTPHWVGFKAVFASSKVTIKTNVEIYNSTYPYNALLKIEIYDNGTWHPLNYYRLDSTTAYTYLRKGTWTLRFSATGYYSQIITLTVDQITETLGVILKEVVTYSGGGGGGRSFLRLMSKVYIYELTINNSEFSAYSVWDGTIVISNLQNKSVYLKVTLHLDYPAVEIYARNITDIQINIPMLYSMLGYSIPDDTFFAIAVDTDATLTVHATLPSQPKECWKTNPNSVHPVKIGDWTWDNGVLTFTVYREDPAFSFIYTTPSSFADLTNMLITVAITLAMLSVAFGMIRRWVG